MNYVRTFVQINSTPKESCLTLTLTETLSVNLSFHNSEWIRNPRWQSTFNIEPYGKMNKSFLFYITIMIVSILCMNGHWMVP